MQNRKSESALALPKIAAVKATSLIQPQLNFIDRHIAHVESKLITKLNDNTGLIKEQQTLLDQLNNELTKLKDENSNLVVLVKEIREQNIALKKGLEQLKLNQQIVFDKLNNTVKFTSAGNDPINETKNLEVSKSKNKTKTSFFKKHF